MPPRRVPHRGVARGGRGRGRGRGGDGPPPPSPPDDGDDAPVPPPGTAPAAAKKARKEQPAELKHVAKWTKEEVAVRSPCPKRIDSPSHVPIVCAQVAAHCWVAACERHSQTSETYRISCTCTSWPEHMDKCFGKKGDGGDGALFVDIKFPMKSRPPNAGGDWTFELSKAKRPLKGSSIMIKGKMVVQKVLNVYLPLMNKFLVDGSLRSGWDDDDLYFAMLYHLYTMFKKRAPG